MTRSSELLSLSTQTSQRFLASCSLSSFCQLLFHLFDSTHLHSSCVTIGMLNILIAQLTITYDKLTADKEGFAMKHR